MSPTYNIQGENTVNITNNNQIFTPQPVASLQPATRQIKFFNNKLHILCSQDKIVQQYPATQKYNQIIKEATSEYMAAKRKKEKMNIVEKTILKIKENGLEFVKYDDKTHSYQPLNRVEKKDKVSHAIRNNIKYMLSK